MPEEHPHDDNQSDNDLNRAEDDEVEKKEPEEDHPEQNSHSIPKVEEQKTEEQTLKCEIEVQMELYFRENLIIKEENEEKLHISEEI